MRRLSDALLFLAIPSGWSRKARRAFLLTLPLSLPLWGAYWLLLFLGFIAGGFLLMAGIVLIWAVSPLVLVVMWSVATVVDLWTTPNPQQEGR